MNQQHTRLTTSAPQLGNDVAQLPALVREKQLINDFIRIGHGTLWGWVADGKFPPPIKLSAGVTAWKREDLFSWANGSWKVEA